MSKHFASSIFSAVCLTLVFTAIWRSDRVLFEQPDPSPLYGRTLERAYSRFKESDIVVPRGRAPRTDDTAIDPFQAAAVGIDTTSNRAVDTEEYARALKLSGEGEHDEAVELLKELLRRPGLQDKLTVQHAIGDVLGAAGQSQLAIRAYRKVLRKDPDHACCFEHIGEIYQRDGQEEMASRMFTNAEEGYSRLIRRSGSRSRPQRVALLKFYVKQSLKPDVALELARELVAEDEKDAEALFLLARSLDRESHVSEALDVLDRTLEAQPGWRDTIVAYRGTLENRLAEEEAQR